MIKSARGLLNPIGLIIFLIGILFGFFAYGYSENYLSITYQREVSFQINPLEVISLIVTVCLAIYVLRVLGREEESEKVERNLLISYFESFDKDLTKVIRRSSQNGVELEYVVSTLKISGMRLQQLLMLAVEQKFIAADSSSSKELPKRIRELNKLLTLTPRTGAVEDGVRVSGGKLSFSEDHLRKINTALFETNNSIFRLIVKINRAKR